MLFIILPNGLRVDVDGGAYFIEDVTMNKVTIVTSTGQRFSQVCTSPTAAQTLIVAIDTFLSTHASSNPVASDGSSAFTFTSLTPNTGLTTDPSFSTVVAGTNFIPAMSGYTWTLDDGSGHVFYPSEVEYISSIEVNLGLFVINYAATYTLYYNGISTGKTVTIS